MGLFERTNLVIRALLLAWLTLIHNFAAPLHDPSGDMVALCDIDGSAARVVAQWSYEPYGDVVAAEHLHSFPVQTLGQKGLFLDRLDAAITAHRLVPFGHGLYHNRNRVYVPALGRFLQQDPNQTAMVVNNALPTQGAILMPTPGVMDLEGLYTDGFSLYQYVGSNPISYSDPTGLFFHNPMPFDPTAGADATGMALGLLEGLVTQYADNLLSDVLWSNDWDADDSWHSRLNNDWMIFAAANGIIDHMGYNPHSPLSHLVFAGNKYRNPITRKGLPGENLSRKMGYAQGGYEKVRGFKRGRHYDGETTIGKSRVLQESKTGPNHANHHTYTQIQKDEIVLADRQADKIVWTFRGVNSMSDLPSSLNRRLKAAKDRYPGRFVVEFIIP